MLEVLMFALAGLIAGIVFGLIPGLHPNLVALFVPLIASISASPVNIITFIVTIAVSNTFVDFIPSMLLGAPEPGKEMAILPAHRMLLEGNGYEAVKLAVVGGLGSVICIILLLAPTAFFIPAVYEIIRPYTHLLLIFIVYLIIASEQRKLLSVGCFFAAGIIGIMSSYTNIDRTLVLFPILSGLFGVSTLLLSAKSNVSIRKTGKEVFITGRQTRRAVLFGSLGGIFSGLLPGVGASEVAALSSVDKNENSFLITVGAVTISNTIMAILAISLISNPRSGVAVVMDQLVTIGVNETVFIIFLSLAVAGVSAIITLKLAKRFLRTVENSDYTKLNWAVIGIIVLSTIFFTGLEGILLLATCTALGLYANISNVRRSVLMGVLLLPTILFYMGF